MDYARMTDEQIRDALYDMHAAIVDRPAMEYLTVSLESAADSLACAIRSVEREGVAA